ncbi:SEC-C metal-binding domain-containing protein [Actinoallomurus sp. CA-150999]|uniref:SEC-C metal-binding domain-containing protein n=1 Tax=Actinoallomurus sp. CA-150999 TaxID=3239887 RepID=UPI003D8F1B01
MNTSSTQRDREKARKHAQDLERDLAVYPDERDEILLEMAGQWADAGETDRALRIYDKIAATAAEEDDAQYAIVEKIHVLDEVDRQDEARAEIARLEKRRPLPGPASLMAEFFEAQGQLEKALTWYNVACRDFFSEAGDEDEPEIGSFDLELAGRARVRKALGLPPDEFDRLAVDGNADMTKALNRVAQRGGPSHAPSTGVGSFFVRSDVKRAFAEGLVHVDDPEDDDVTSYFRRVERGWRETCHEGGVTNLVILPTTVDDLLRYGDEHGRDPKDQQTRMEYLQDRVEEEASTLHWPPERNQPCWCDSGRKYKKCCGSPANR